MSQGLVVIKMLLKTSNYLSFFEESLKIPLHTPVWMVNGMNIFGILNLFNFHLLYIIGHPSPFSHFFFFQETFQIYLFLFIPMLLPWIKLPLLHTWPPPLPPWPSSQGTSCRPPRHAAPAETSSLQSMSGIAVPAEDTSLHMEQPPAPLDTRQERRAHGHCLSLTLMLGPNPNMSLSYLLDKQDPRWVTCPGVFLNCEMCWEQFVTNVSWSAQIWKRF